jgi:hypothetical protein
MVSYRFEQREIAHLVIACALSPDGKYFAVIGRKHKPKDYVYAWLIELDNNGRGRTLFEQQIIPNKRLNINATDYSHIKSQKETLKDLYVKIQLVYDEYHNCFHIFIPAYMPSYEGTHVNPVFDLYTLNIASPSLTRKADLKAGNFDDHGKAEYEMRWSCIDGNLVGIYAKNPERSIDALIYTNGELLKCSLNNGIWEYTPSGNQTKEANFTIIGIPELNDFEYHDYRNNDRFAIEKNFIPSFTEIIQKNARALLTVKNPIRMRFDPRHLRLNYIYEHPAGKVNCVISSPCNPYLLEGCHILDKAKDTADILPTACFLYQYHTNSKSWHIQCKSIFDSVLPEIKKLYGITTAEQRVEIQPIPAPVSVIQPQPAKPAPAPTPSPVPTPQQTPAPQPKIAPAPAKPSPQGWRAWVGQMYGNVLKRFGFRS